MLVDRWLLGPVADPPEPDHDPAEVRETADEILSRPEYQEPPESLIERIQNWLDERLSDVLSGLSFGGALPSFVAWLLLTLLVAAVVALLVYLVRNWAWTKGPKRAKRPSADVVLAAEDHRSPTEWLAEAERHEREGRWREGLLCRYRALVTELVRREVIPELVGRTAGEYVDDVRRQRPDLAPSFAAATDLFEAAWYGGAETGSAERDRFVERAEATLAPPARILAGAST